MLKDVVWKKQGWAKENAQVLQDLILENQSTMDTPKYDRNYAVSDWDNTSAMYDVQDAVFLYQLFELRYEMNPRELLYVLRKDFDMQEDSYVHRLTAWIVDIYEILYQNKKELGVQLLKKDETYRDFVAAMIYFYHRLSYELLSYGQGCHRILYLFYRMTEEEVRELTRDALQFWKEQPLQILRMEFEFEGEILHSSIQTGIRSIPQQVDLYESLRKHYIDVYICTASSEMIVEEAASSELLGYGFSKGEVAGMNLIKDEEGRFLAEVDTNKILTYMQGKADYLSHLQSRYGTPPILFMGDSDGDYQALTYPGLKVGLIVNIVKTGEINRLKEVAAKPYEEGTRYLLQGRDERIGEFIDSTESIELS